MGPAPLALCCIAALMAILVLLIPHLPSRYSRRALTGLPLLLLAACSGAIAVSCTAYTRNKAAASAGEGIYRFSVQDRVPTKNGGYRLTTSAARLEGNLLHPVSGKTILYAGNRAGAADFLPGGSFFAPARLQVIEGPLNPGEPDFQRIHARDGIYTSAFLLSTQLRSADSTKGNSMHDLLYRQRMAMLRILRTYIGDSTASGLAEAILLGYRNDLSADLGQAYARTGVMHVIAISGLHLGLIFSILLFLFNFIPGARRRPWLPLLVAVPAIWWFSFLTGASASVMRSAVMSSLPVLGVLLHRRTWTINVCCVSILALLAWNPYWLWDAGFQLSYAAVWGILLYQRPLMHRVNFRHPAARWIWELIAVTLAAQVFTTPLVVHYFHQFPLLFLFANLVAVPLSSIILLGTMLICLLAAFPSKAAVAGEWTEWLIHFLNNFIRRIDMVPDAVVQHLYINSPSLGLIFGLIICLHVSLRKGGRKWLGLAAFCLSLVIAALTARWTLTNSQTGLCIMQIKGHTAIIQLRGRHAEQFLLPSLRQPAERVPFVTAAVRTHFRTTEYQSILLPQAAVQVLRTGRMTIIIVSGPCHKGLEGRMPRADIILLRVNAGASSLECWHKATGCVRFVADGTNSLWKIQQWREEAKKLPLRLHSTPLQGAFLLD